MVADNGGTGNGNCLVEGGDGSDFFTIQSNGNVNFASGNGITFADSSTSQVLDDYEEGSWTPTFVSTGASWAYNHQYGYYQKVGNTVHVSFYITLGNGTVVTGTTSNSLHIAVPFTATGATRYEAACCFSMIYKFNTNANVAGDIPLTGRLYSGESKIDLLAQFEPNAQEGLFSLRLQHWIQAPLLAYRYRKLEKLEDNITGYRNSVKPIQAYCRRLHQIFSWLLLIGITVHIITVTFFANYVADGRPIYWLSLIHI